jgi:hypothetical protein
MKKVGVNRVESQQVYATKMNLHTHLNICNRGLNKLGLIAADFAILPNKIDKITGKFENIDKATSQWVFCQH